MAEFKYKVKNQNGDISEGLIDAPDQDAGVEILHNRGYIILSLDPANKNILTLDINAIISRPNNKDLVIFTRQLSTLIDADMPLAQSLRTLSKQIEKPVLKRIIEEISDTVEGGSSLSAALANHSNLFTPFFIKLVQSGEVSGKLHETLLYLADYLERSQSINSKIRGALAYPAFIVFALIVVVIIMATYVLPTLLSIFKDVGTQDLPITTRVLIFLIDVFNKYKIYIAIGLAVLGFSLWRYLKTEQGRAQYDLIKIKFPSLGIVVRNLYLARISESLSTLIKSGIPILETLRITSELVGNVHYKAILLNAEESVRGGGSISEVFSRYKEMPPLITSMVAIGEKTGKLDYMLEHVSKFYKSEAENSVQNITQLIEPILVLVLGVGVALLVSSILMPIYSMVGSI